MPVLSAPDGRGPGGASGLSWKSQGQALDKAQLGRGAWVIGTSRRPMHEIRDKSNLGGGEGPGNCCARMRSLRYGNFLQKTLGALINLHINREEARLPSKVRSQKTRVTMQETDNAGVGKLFAPPQKQVYSIRVGATGAHTWADLNWKRANTMLNECEGDLLSRVAF